MSENFEFVFSVSGFCSQILTFNSNLWLKIGPTYEISKVKRCFLNFCLRNYVLLFFTKLELLILQLYCETFRKLNKRNLLKICLQVTLLTDFCIICTRFKMKKVKMFDFL